MPQNASTIGMPKNEVLPSGTISRRAPVIGLCHLNMRDTVFTSSAETNNIIHGMRIGTRRSFEKVRRGTCSRIKAGKET